MAYADATAAGYAACAESATDHGLEPPAAQFCERAIGAIEEAIGAISQGDVPARCKAVSRATEATTSLFLALEAGSPAGPVGQGPNRTQRAGQVYQAILSRLVEVNLRNDAGTAGAAIRLLEAFRSRYAGPAMPGPLAPAAQTALARRL